MSDAEHPRPRLAGRVIVVDPDRRVLMIRGEDPGAPEQGGFWFTPGGGVEGDETTEEAARREVKEEIGLELGSLGPVVMERVSVFRLDATWYRQEEAIYFAEIPAGFEPNATFLDETELSSITDLRWLALEDLSSLDEPHYPVGLVELVRHVDRAGAPVPPWREVTDGR